MDRPDSSVLELMTTMDTFRRKGRTGWTTVEKNPPIGLKTSSKLALCLLEMKVDTNETKCCLSFVHQVLCDRICFLRRPSGASHSCLRSAWSDRLPDAHCSRSGIPRLELRRGLLDGGLTGEPLTQSQREDHQYRLSHGLSSLLVFLQDSDLSLPSCSTAQVQASCSSVCTGSSWTVSLAVSDSGRSSLAALQLLKGQGVLTLFHSPPAGEDGQQQNHHRQGGPEARLEAGDAPFNVSSWELGSSQPLWVRYSSSCCSSQAELLVWNTAGNMKRCYLTSGQQRQQRDQNAETSGTGRTENVSFFMFSWTIFLLWSSPL